jgi:hypothetical protein
MNNADDALSKDMAPIWEAYGKACFQCQNLESSFRFLLILNASKDTGEVISNIAVESVETETSQYTLNKIFRLAQEKEYFKRNEITMLIKANKTRNNVIHNYWNDRSNIEKMMTPEGRLALKLDLEKLSSELWRANQIVVRLIDRYLIALGLTTEILKSFTSNMYEEGRVEIPNKKH